MKMLLELRQEVDLGLHVCAPNGDNVMCYIFRRPDNGHIVHAYGYAPGQFTIYHDCRFDDPEEGLEHDVLAQQPIWAVCTIHNMLMQRFLYEAEELEHWYREHNAQGKIALLKMKLKKGEQGKQDEREEW